jgi:hypothetical protein
MEELNAELEEERTEGKRREAENKTLAQIAREEKLGVCVCVCVCVCVLVRKRERRRFE